MATLKRTVQEFRADNLTDWAVALTYYGLLAVRWRKAQYRCRESSAFATSPTSAVGYGCTAPGDHAG